jgi:hypothetical protein
MTHFSYGDDLTHKSAIERLRISRISVFIPSADLDHGMTLASTIAKFEGWRQGQATPGTLGMF